jgi:hypothetical protein
VGLFGRLFGGRLSNLISASLERKEDATWNVVWVADRYAAAPADFSSPSLGEAITRAGSEVAQLYANRSEAAGAELMLAIYPWPGKAPGKIMLDITPGDEGRFKASDIQGGSTSVEAANVEDLVLEAEGALPVPGDAMFRWIRKVSELEL